MTTNHHEKRVAFQGMPGAYSDEAARTVFPNAETVGHPTFSEAFDAIAERRVDAAVIPVENTVAGVVQEVSDLLWKHTDLHVIGEHVSPIRHVLMSKSNEPVTRVLSHPQALAQCSDWLRRNGLEPVPFYDTAGAAAEIARRSNVGEGAIASRAAAKLYDLNILATDIANSASNQTRFLIIEQLPLPEATGEGTRKVTLGFTTNHEPGALAGVMAIFSNHRANLTRLDSRPIPDQPFRYRFYAEAEVENGEVAELVRELGDSTVEFRLFGSYLPQSPTQ